MHTHSRMVTTVKLMNTSTTLHSCHLCIYVVRISEISQQISSIQYNNINYSHRAVQYYLLRLNHPDLFLILLRKYFQPITDLNVALASVIITHACIGVL